MTKVWRAYKRICGPAAKNFMLPPFDEDEVQLLKEVLRQHGDEES